MKHRQKCLLHLAAVKTYGITYASSFSVLTKTYSIYCFSTFTSSTFHEGWEKRGKDTSRKSDYFPFKYLCLIINSVQLILTDRKQKNTISIQFRKKYKKIFMEIVNITIIINSCNYILLKASNDSNANNRLFLHTYPHTYIPSCLHRVTSTSAFAGVENIYFFYLLWLV